MIRTQYILMAENSDSQEYFRSVTLVYITLLSALTSTSYFCVQKQILIPLSDQMQHSFIESNIYHYTISTNCSLAISGLELNSMYYRPLRCLSGVKKLTKGSEM